MKVRIVRPCSADFNDENFPGAQIEEIIEDGKFISEVLDEEYLKQIFYKYADLKVMILSAQMGKGKNFWVNHVLRFYASKKNARILYLCNRNALNKQQLQEATQAVNPALHKSNFDKNIYEYETGSMTIMTYHQFYINLIKNHTAKFENFDFAILDEAHFFFSDSLFNPDTERILNSIPVILKNAYRIYMTATPSKVMDLIYSAEWRADNGGNFNGSDARYCMAEKKFYGLESLPKIPMIKFPWDFSHYVVHSFKTDATLVKEVKQQATDENKWIIFVTSRRKGLEMREEILQEGISVTYMDRESRNSKRLEDRQAWERLLETGNLGKDLVLITTSVLDNGFSVHDSAVKNVALFTDEKIEFLQELGRIRLKKDQKLKVYFKEMNRLGYVQPNRHDDIMNIFALWYGNSEIHEYMSQYAEIEANPAAVLKRQMYLSEPQKLGYVGFDVMNNAPGEIESIWYINNIARYVARDMKKEAEKFAEFERRYGDLAPILYKAAWLTNSEEKLEKMPLINMEVEKGEMERNHIKEFLDPFIGVKMKEESGTENTELTKKFQEFSKGFQKLFVEIFPNDKSLNLGKNRKTWKHQAINNHLMTMAEQIEGLPKYQLKQNPDMTWSLDIIK